MVSGSRNLWFWPRALTGEWWYPGLFPWSRIVTQPIERDAIYRRRRLPREVIGGCVRWYQTYRLSYRDLVAMMAEFDVHVMQTTIMRSVLRTFPNTRSGGKRRAKSVGLSRGVDETYIQTQPKTEVGIPLSAKRRESGVRLVPQLAVSP
jgi:hypothetical protein